MDPEVLSTSGWTMASMKISVEVEKVQDVSIPPLSSFLCVFPRSVAWTVCLQDIAKHRQWIWEFLSRTVQLEFRLLRMKQRSYS